MVSKFPSNILFHQQMFSLLDTLSADKACVRGKEPSIDENFRDVYKKNVW